MKNSFCRICRGRFNLKYPPAAVDSKNRKLNSRFIAARIDESGEYSDNICWDCEDTLLGFHKSVSEDNNDEEEPVVVDDDEILYKSLEKTIRIHRLSKEVEIIKIDSSDSEHEERVIVPKQDDIVPVESASTTVGYSKNNCESYLNHKAVAVKRNIFGDMNSDLKLKKENISRSKIFESMRCPLCPYLSGIEYEVVFHIRRSHPHYTGDHLRFEHQEGDSILTRRIIFVQLWTFFECKACGKLHDRFWPHRKHLTAHDRKCLKDTFDDDILTPNNNELFNSHDPTDKVQTSKRALDSFEDMPDPKSIKTEDRNLRRNSKDNNCNFVETTNKPLAISISKSLENSAKQQHQLVFPSDSKKSKSKGLLRKQQMMQMKREKRAQKRTEKKKTEPKKSAPVIPKPTFKMPQQPAPRASTVVKQIVQHFRYTCKFCTETLSSFIDWNMHMIRVHSLTEFKANSIVTSNNNVCKKCDKSFASVGEVRLHIQLSHRRKYRLVEINGNDDEEICRQTLTPKKESKDEKVSGEKMSVLMNGDLEPPEPPNVTMSSAFLCQFCGILFPTLMACTIHQSSHVVNREVKRIFPTKSQA